MEIKKDIRYLGRNFPQFRENLLNFVKTYYQNTINDFDPNDPAIMFIEVSAYVGDVLSFYLDTQIKENILLNASESKNVLSIAQSLGYKPLLTTPALTDLDVYQIIPSIGSGINNQPDYNYALKIKKGMEVSSISNNSIIFRTTQDLDFGFSSAYSPTEVSVYQIDDNTQEPTFYLLKKSVPIKSGRIKQTTFNFTNPIRYNSVDVSDTNIIGIESVVDSDGNDWTEVDYLAQDTVFDKIKNISTNNSDLSQYSSTTPFLLKLKHVPKRFITRFNEDLSLKLQFGSGVINDIDEEYTPNPDSIGLSIPTGINKTNYNWDISNFMFTDAYGQVPFDTTLTVRYSVGNGLNDNVLSNTLRNIITTEYDLDETGLDSSLLRQIKQSLSVNNSKSAVGGKVVNDIDEVKNNAMANFAAQGRTVSLEDYTFRVLNMPSEFGSIAKVFVIQDQQINQTNKNPFALNLYILSFDLNKNLCNANTAIKENLRVYIDRYRMLTDAINIKDAYIVNIRLFYEITVLADYADKEVLLYCNEAMKDFFNIDKMQINQPIIKSDVVRALANVQGVQSVISVGFENVTEVGYSENIYDIQTATRSDIIYPSMDPMIFEIKYPNKDIYGRVVNY